MLACFVCRLLVKLRELTFVCEADVYVLVSIKEILHLNFTFWVSGIRGTTVCLSAIQKLGKDVPTVEEIAISHSLYTAGHPMYQFVNRINVTYENI